MMELLLRFYLFACSILCSVGAYVLFRLSGRLFMDIKFIESIAIKILTGLGGIMLGGFATGLVITSLLLIISTFKHGKNDKN